MKRQIMVIVAALLILAVAAGAALLPARPAAADRGGTNDISLLSPVRITAMDDGPLLVSDYASGSVCTVSRSSLRIPRCFTLAGRPLGVAWSQDRIYVGNETTGTVEVYNPDGKLLFRFGTEGAVKVPGGIAADPGSGRIFVVDSFEKNIKVFDPAGSLLYTISGDAAGSGQLVNPVEITVDPARSQVLVSDYGDPAASYPARIRIYDYAGNFVLALSGKTGGFSRPQGLSVSGDLIFVADGMLGQVLVFDRSTLAKVRTLGSFGAGPGQLMLPLDVLVDPRSGDVFVTNNRNGRVERFEKGGIVP